MMETVAWLSGMPKKFDEVNSDFMVERSVTLTVGNVCICDVKLCDVIDRWRQWSILAARRCHA